MITLYDIFKDAVDMCNKPVYRLQARVFTQTFRRLRVWAVLIADIPIFRVDMISYGGPDGPGVVGRVPGMPSKR